MQSRLKLPPGRYQLRMAARETGGGRVGSVTYDLDVPDFTKAPLTMSGILIASGEGQGVMTAKADEELRTRSAAAAHRLARVPRRPTR